MLYNPPELSQSLLKNSQPRPQKKSQLLPKNLNPSEKISTPPEKISTPSEKISNPPE